MSSLQHKIALITGATSGIGPAVARRFAAEGAVVYITGRRGDKLEEIAAEVGPNARPITADVTSSDDLDRLFGQIEREVGRLDILVDSAGLSEPASIAELGEVHYDRHFDLNVKATVFTTQRAVRLMGDGGAIVLIGSIAGAIGTPSFGAYGASKAAVRAFARTWANELSAQHIRVNVVSPGPIDTPMFESVEDEARAVIAARIPMGRLGKPEEVAAAALFLASNESSFITGAALDIDGGMTQV